MTEVASTGTDRGRWRSLARDPVTLTACLLVLGFTLAALAAPIIAPADPLAANLGSQFGPPSRVHFLGTDQLGRDMLSRLLYGARWSLSGALVVTALVTVIGVGIGAASGYVGGAVDGVIMRVVDGLLAFPTLLLALVIVAFVGPGFGGIVLALVAVGWAGYARIVRGLVLSLRERDHVVAARAVGTGHGRIILRHLLPHLLSPIAVLATLEIGQLILALAGLSFLGLGVQPPTPEWGSMINEGRTYLFRAPQLMVYPGITVTLAVLGFNLLGDRLSEVLGPRLDDRSPRSRPSGRPRSAAP